MRTNSARGFFSLVVLGLALVWWDISNESNKKSVRAGSLKLLNPDKGKAKQLFFELNNIEFKLLRSKNNWSVIYRGQSYMGDHNSIEVLLNDLKSIDVKPMNSSPKGFSLNDYTGTLTIATENSPRSQKWSFGGFKTFEGHSYVYNLLTSKVHNANRNCDYLLNLVPKKFISNFVMLKNSQFKTLNLQYDDVKFDLKLKNSKWSLKRTPSVLLDQKAVKLYLNGLLHLSGTELLLSDHLKAIDVKNLRPNISLSGRLEGGHLEGARLESDSDWRLDIYKTQSGTWGVVKGRDVLFRISEKSFKNLKWNLNDFKDKESFFKFKPEGVFKIELQVNNQLTSIKLNKKAWVVKATKKTLSSVEVLAWLTKISKLRARVLLENSKLSNKNFIKLYDQFDKMIWGIEWGGPIVFKKPPPVGRSDIIRAHTLNPRVFFGLGKNDIELFKEGLLK